MSRLADYLYAIAIALWVGALWSIGYIAAPTLFMFVADRGLAGTLAGKMFAIVAWLGMGCSVYLLTLWLIVLMLVLTLAGHFGVTPIVEKLRIETAREMVESVVRSRFQTWHGIASILWMIQSVLGVLLVTQTFKR